MEKKNPFEDFEVISTYSDQEAIDDGILVDLTPLGIQMSVGANLFPVNRMTSNLFNQAFDGVENEANDCVEICVDVIAEWCRRVALQHQVDFPSLLVSYWNKGNNEDVKIWFVENEVGGYTAMLPEDY